MKITKIWWTIKDPSGIRPQFVADTRRGAWMRYISAMYCPRPIGLTKKTYDELKRIVRRQGIKPVKIMVEEA